MDDERVQNVFFVYGHIEWKCTYRPKRSWKRHRNRRVLLQSCQRRPEPGRGNVSIVWAIWRWSHWCLEFERMDAPEKCSGEDCTHVYVPDGVHGYGTDREQKDNNAEALRSNGKRRTPGRDGILVKVRLDIIQGLFVIPRCTLPMAMSPSRRC